MANPPSKSQRIDLWRHEVAQAALQASSTGASPDATSTSTAPEQKRRSRPSSFLAKLLKVAKSSNNEEEEVDFESTAMYRVTQVTDGARFEARASGRRYGDDQKGQDGGQEGVSRSMAIVDVSVSSSSADGELLAKKERLERAARLLGKEGGREGKG
jgi:uncharacterized protein (DUF885 family)